MRNILKIVGPFFIITLFLENFILLAEVPRRPFLFKDARGESIDEYLENYIKNGLCTSRESNVLKKVAIKSETPWIWNCALIVPCIPKCVTDSLGIGHYRSRNT